MFVVTYHNPSYICGRLYVVPLEVPPQPAPWEVWKPIKNGTQLFLCSWEPVDGFVPVIVNGRNYLVEVDHVHITEMTATGDSWVWTPLSDAEFYEGVHVLHPSSFSIRVYESNMLLLAEEEFEVVKSLCNNKLNIVEQFMERCTYVSLEVGNPIYAWVHSTLAYAASMDRRAMNTLKRLLSEHLESYWELEPCDRPDRLLTFRQFEYKEETEVGYDSCDFPREKAKSAETISRVGQGYQYE